MIGELQRSQAAWVSAQEAAMAQDLTQITTEEELQHDIAAAQAYAAATTKHEQFTKEYIDQMEKALVDAQIPTAYRDGVIRGAQNSMVAVKPTMDKVFAAHKDYAACLLDLLNLMGAEWGAWQFDETNGFLFENDAAHAQFNEHLNRAIGLEEQINTLSAELLRISQPRAR